MKTSDAIFELTIGNFFLEKSIIKERVAGFGL